MSVRYALSWRSVRWNRPISPVLTAQILDRESYPDVLRATQARQRKTMASLHQRQEGHQWTVWEAGVNECFFSFGAEQ